MLSPLLIVTLILVLGAEFVNGWTDAPNAIATVVSTRVLSPGKAVLMAAVLNLAGAIATGTAVATTIGSGIVKPGDISLPVVAAAMLTILVWSGITWFYALPSSKSHELIAGLTGAGFAAAGSSALLWSGWEKVIIGLGFSTIIGFAIRFHYYDYPLLDSAQDCPGLYPRSFQPFADTVFSLHGFQPRQ